MEEPRQQPLFDRDFGVVATSKMALVADGDDVIERLADEFGGVFGFAARNVEADFFHGRGHDRIEFAEFDTRRATPLSASVSWRTRFVSPTQLRRAATFRLPFSRVQRHERFWRWFVDHALRCLAPERAQCLQKFLPVLAAAGYLPALSRHAHRCMYGHFSNAECCFSHRSAIL